MPLRHIVQTLATLCALAVPSTLLAEGKSIIVLDASGSMWGQIDGRPKLEIAREALGTVLSGLPADTELGLMAYGHREKGSCEDIELIVPPAKGTAAAITAAAQSMKFLGKTPLSEAVRRAAGDLRSTEEKATVILITDGIETCNADPCALGAELEASGVDFTAHVVGFGLTADEGKQVACLAENTGGKYIDAKDAGTLIEALKTTVAAAPEPAPAPAPAPEPAKPAKLDINFKPTAFLAEGVPLGQIADVAWQLTQITSGGEAGESVLTEYNKTERFVEPGTYRLFARVGEANVEQDITFTADTLSAPQVIMNAGVITLNPVGIEGGPELTGAGINVANDTGMNRTAYGKSLFIVPAGPVTITGSAGQASVSETVQIKAGETITRDLLIASGLAVVDAFYVPGMKMEGSGHGVTIYGAKKAIDGKRKDFGTAYNEGSSFTLPPGDYVAYAYLNSAGAETPFSIKAGELTEVSVVLNAGVIAVTATGAAGIEVLEAKADLNGNRKSLVFDYAEDLTKTMAAGDVLVRANVGDKVVEQPATIVAGERTEVTLNMQ